MNTKRLMISRSPQSRISEPKTIRCRSKREYLLQETTVYTSGRLTINIRAFIRTDRANDKNNLPGDKTTPTCIINTTVEIYIISITPQPNIIYIYLLLVNALFFHTKYAYIIHYEKQTICFSYIQNH